MKLFDPLSRACPRPRHMSPSYLFLSVRPPHAILRSEKVHDGIKASKARPPVKEPNAPASQNSADLLPIK